MVYKQIWNISKKSWFFSYCLKIMRSKNYLMDEIKFKQNENFKQL